MFDMFNFCFRAVFFASLLVRKSMAARIKATILYATETGKSETLARKLHTLFSFAFKTKVSTVSTVWSCTTKVYFYFGVL